MKIKFLLLITLVAVSLAPGLAAGQSSNQTVPGGLVEDIQNEETCTEPEAIDRDTVLCSKELDGNTVTLVLRSDRLQSVTVTDALGVFKGGPVAQTRHQLRADEPNTIEVPITRDRDKAAVTIETGGTLYGVPFDQTNALIGSPWSSTDVQLAALTASLSTALVAALVVLRTIYGRTDEPERIA